MHQTCIYVYVLIMIFPYYTFTIIILQNLNMATASTTADPMDGCHDRKTGKVLTCKESCFKQMQSSLNMIAKGQQEHISQ